MKLSYNLKSLRKRSGYSVSDISRYLGISSDTYKLFEDGNAEDMSGEDLERLADLYNVDAYDILTNEEGIWAASLIPAFRKSGEISDLSEIAQFQRIVRNYVMMSDLLEKHNG